MYNAIKTNALTEEEAREIVGDEIVESLLSSNCQFSGRVIDECHEVQEMTSSETFTDKDGEECIIKISFLIPQHDVDTFEDAGDYDYSNYYFYIY